MLVMHQLCIPKLLPLACAKANFLETLGNTVVQLQLPMKGDLACDDCGRYFKSKGQLVQKDVSIS